VAVATGDLIRCVDFQSLLGQTVLNVYYFIWTPVLPGSDGYLEDANTSFLDLYMPSITAVQVNTLEHTHREWRNLTNGVDLFDDDTVIPGDIDSGQPLNSFTSLGFMLRRDSLVTRNGYKRFAGLVEGDVQGNDWVGGDTRIDNLKAALMETLVTGIVPSLAPIIVKRPIPEPAVDYDHSGIVSVAFRGLGTQNSRKPGRGI